jgi:filamentous hemagglutinin family protein
MKYSLKVLFCLGLTTGGALAVSGNADAVLAQTITPDGSLSTTVTKLDNRITIGQGQTLGDSLFHSFHSFSLSKGDQATFDLTGQSGIRQIFSRVTGGKISQIDGLIQVKNGTDDPVSLFLLNPAGIVFGPGARLDLNGSFLASTASSIQFADGQRFGPGEQPLLRVTVPVGLGFGAEAGGILVQGESSGDGPRLKEPSQFSETAFLGGLTVGAQQTIALVANGIDLQGGILQAPGGQIALGSVAPGSFVQLDQGLPNYQALPNYSGVQLQPIQLRQQALLNTSGGDGGQIQLTGSTIDLKQHSTVLSSNETGLTTRGITFTASQDIQFDQSYAYIVNFGPGKGGEMTLTGRDLRFSNGSTVVNHAWGNGSPGQHLLRGRSIEWLRGSAIGTIAFNQQGSGKITMEAEEHILTDGKASGFTIFAAGAVNQELLNIKAKTFTMRDNSGFSVAGWEALDPDGNIYATDQNSSIRIAVDRLEIDRNSGFVTTSWSKMNSPDILIQAKEINVQNQSGFSSQAFGTGHSGDIKIITDRLNLLDNSAIYSQSSGLGDSGSLDIRANSITLAENSRISSRNGGEASDEFYGRSGALRIQSDRLMLDRGSLIDASINSANTKVDGADINISADQITIKNGSQIISNTKDLANAGSIYIKAQDLSLEGVRFDGVVVTERVVDGSYFEGEKNFEGVIGNQDLASGIFSDALAQGMGGDINLQVDRFTLSDGALISAKTSGAGQAGSIFIAAQQAVAIAGSQRNFQSQITASSLGAGDAGSIWIRSPELRLSDRALISVSGTGLGQAGNINLEASQFIQLKASQISTNAANQANGGEIRINSPFVIGLNNSDIIANAQQGMGGQISITSNSLLGFKPGQQLTPGSDITASSDLGLNGTIELNTINTDPIQSIAQLPGQLLESSDRIQNQCEALSQSQFIVTGRSGLPSSPLMRQSAAVLWQDSRLSQTPAIAKTAADQRPPSEARSWVRQGDRIVLHSSPDAFNPSLRPTCARQA